MNPSLDNRDRVILEERIAARDRIPGPRVGDYIRMLDGSLRRFTAHWPSGLQITYKPVPCGSYYLSRHGHMSYSGGLDPVVPFARIRVAPDEMLSGDAWFFHHDDARAHNGVDVLVPCRVYEETPV